jgi:hypothetical protein
MGGPVKFGLLGPLEALSIFERLKSTDADQVRDLLAELSTHPGEGALTPARMRHG